jgi:hypothetical protein
LDLYLCFCNKLHQHYEDWYKHGKDEAIMAIQDNPARVSIFLVSLLLLLVITPFFSVSLTTAQDVTVATTDQTTSDTVITKDDAKTDTTNTITQTKTFFNQLSDAAKTAADLYPDVRSGTYTTRPAPEDEQATTTDYAIRTTTYGDEPTVYSPKQANTSTYSITQPPAMPSSKTTGRMTGAYSVTQPPAVKMTPLIMPTVTPATPIQPPPISGGGLGLGGNGNGQITGVGDVTGYINEGTGFITDAVNTAFAHKEILYMMAILIIAAIFAQIGGWRIGVIGLVGMLLVCAGITLSTGAMIIPPYVIFVIVIIAVSLVLLAFTRITGGGE